MLQLSEVLPGTERSEAQVNTLYRWKPLKDEIIKDKESYRLVEEIRMHTGMTDEEIKKNVDEKVDILKWFVKKQIKDLNKVGRVVAAYYSDPDQTLKGIGKDQDIEKIIQG
jgi:ferritin